MSDYRLTFSRPARKELQALDRPVLVRVFASIEKLAADARPAGCRKIRGAKSLWRIRVGDYRVIYDVDDAGSRVDVIAVRHRRDAYR